MTETAVQHRRMNPHHLNTAATIVGSDRLVLDKGNYASLPEMLERNGLKMTSDGVADMVLMDLGVSSMQLDQVNPVRGTIKNAVALGGGGNGGCIVDEKAGSVLRLGSQTKTNNNI